MKVSPPRPSAARRAALGCALWLGVAALSPSAAAQQLYVAPYLQLATPSSMVIMWETSGAPSGAVEWGPTMALGNSTPSPNLAGPNGTQRHTVTLTSLAPDTRYFYRTVNGALTSDVTSFVTPPTPSAEASFNLLAMSDMQLDAGNPSKFDEIIGQGAIPFVQSELAPDLADALAMVLVPGDLVENGLIYSQFANDFFAPGAPLFAQVPLYPVAGNHENDSDYFFDYFALPENGSSGLLEHWWYHDYSNLRVIGLDTNDSYRIAMQLDWLQQLLDDTCQLPHIDFVFAQLHHPHLSELWVDGELDYTGEIISRLETFSTQCDKPSIHFFGHTHGYSRGQSRDHKHLWVNVATAGGNIDYWDEYTQADYEEFTVTQDEWGFVLVEVDAGQDPQFRLRRISRGNEVTPRDNEVRDEITIRRDNAAPEAPQALSPSAADAVAPGLVTLVASPYADPDDDLHGASHFQLASSCNDFSEPLAERWLQHENQYQSVDLNHGIDLTVAQLRLPVADSYCWRVRYRDRGLQYSAWSAPLPFVVDAYTRTDNLLRNPGAEQEMTHWQISSGTVESLLADECGGITPYRQQRYFVAGGLCSSGQYGEALQQVSLGDYAQDIDGGLVRAQFGGALANYSGDDVPAIQLLFLNENGDTLAQSAVLQSSLAEWTELSHSELVPLGTRSVHFVISGTRNAGEDNDSYLDALDLRLWLPGDTAFGGGEELDDEGCSCNAVGRSQPPPLAPAAVTLAGLIAMATRRRRNERVH